MEKGEWNQRKGNRGQNERATRGVGGLSHPAPRQILRNLQGAEHKWARVHDVSVRADSTVNRVFREDRDRRPVCVGGAGETLKTGHVAILRAEVRFPHVNTRPDGTIAEPLYN